MTTTFSLSEKARATSRKTRTKTSTNVLPHVYTNNEVIKFLQRGQNKDYNTDTLPKHDCKTKCKETIKNEAAYQMLRMFSNTRFGVRGTEKKLTQISELSRHVKTLP